MFNKIKTNMITFIHECNLGGKYTWSYLITATRARHNRLGYKSKSLAQKNTLISYGWNLKASQWSNPAIGPPLLNT